MCGGTSVNLGLFLEDSGLSPRVRGNRFQLGNPSRLLGTIPACAGEPCWAPQQAKAGRDYPRVCGGTKTWPAASNPVLGLSPRVRGNPSTICLNRSRAGTIPACAGEPVAWCNSSTIQRDYPRVCGGTILMHPVPWSSAGLSPRVRGNPLEQYTRR